MFAFTPTTKLVLGFAAGVVIGATGYKLVSEKKINLDQISKAVSNLANKVKKPEAETAEEPKA